MTRILPPVKQGYPSSSFRSGPEEQLSDPPPLLSGVLSCLSLSRVGISHLHWLCAGFQPELWLQTKSLTDQFPNHSTLCVRPPLVSVEQGCPPRGMSLLRGSDRTHRVNPSVLLGRSPLCHVAQVPALCWCQFPLSGSRRCCWSSGS